MARPTQWSSTKSMLSLLFVFFIIFLGDGLIFTVQSIVTYYCLQETLGIGYICGGQRNGCGPSEGPTHVLTLL